MSAALATLAAAGITAAANIAYQKYQAEKDNQEWDRRQSELYRLSQESQRNAASNEAAGLRLAGLSPVLANGSAAASVPSAPAPQREPVKFDSAALASLASQIKLTDASAHKAEAEAQNIEQTTAERKTAGRTASLNLFNMFSDLAEKYKDDPNRAAFYQSMADEARDAGEAASGAAVGLRDFQNLEAESYESRYRILEARFKSIISEGQFDEASKHAEFFSMLRDAPKTEQLKILAEIAKFAADRSNLKALEDLTVAKTTLTNEQVSQVKAMTERLESYNLPALLKKGDYRGFAAGIIGLIIEGVAKKGM